MRGFSDVVVFVLRVGRMRDRKSIGKRVKWSMMPGNF